MNTCPTREELIEYRQGNVTVDEGLRINMRIVNCQQCQSFVLRDPEAAMEQLLRTIMGVDEPQDCPSDVLLDRYARGKANWFVARRVTKHLNGCSICHRVVEYLREEFGSSQHISRGP